MGSLLRRYPFSAFTILSFAWTWPLAALSSRSLVFPLAALFGPALAAMAVVAATEGRAGLRGLFSRFRVRRGDWPWLAVAVLLPLALLVPLWLLGSWRTLTGSPAFALRPITPLSLLLAVLIVGEEVGWRGFGQPCLLRRWPALAAALGLGAVWAVWHAPNFLLPGFPHHGLPFVPFLILLMAYSVLFTWLHRRTAGSLTVAVAFHAALNLFSLANVLPALDYWHRAVVYGVVAGIVVAAGGLRESPPS
jgi:membrane protease YdiL (CAAX protease family)